MALDLHFTAFWLLAVASCILAMTALSYLFWHASETDFVLVVSLLVYGFLLLALLAMLRPWWG